MYIYYVYNMCIYVYNKNIDMYRLGSPVHTHIHGYVCGHLRVYLFILYIG